MVLLKGKISLTANKIYDIIKNMDKNNNKKVLIIEDDQALQKAISEKLRQNSINFEVASNGSEGVEKFKEYKPDIVILDLLMPQKSGVETLKEIRQMDLVEKTRVIVLSNIGSFETVSKCLEYNAVEYFIKSDISLDKIIEIINQ